MDFINAVIECLNYLFVIDNTSICKSSIIKFIVFLTSLIYIYIYIYIVMLGNYKFYKLMCFLTSLYRAYKLMCFQQVKHNLNIYLLGY